MFDHVSYEPQLFNDGPSFQIHHLQPASFQAFATLRKWLRSMQSGPKFRIESPA